MFQLGGDDCNEKLSKHSCDNFECNSWRINDHSNIYYILNHIFDRNKISNISIESQWNFIQVELYVFVLFEGKLASYINIMNEGSVGNLQANQKKWMRISYNFIDNSNFSNSLNIWLDYWFLTQITQPNSNKILSAIRCQSNFFITIQFKCLNYFHILSFFLFGKFYIATRNLRGVSQSKFRFRVTNGNEIIISPQAPSFGQPRLLISKPLNVRRFRRGGGLRNFGYYL